MSNINEIEERLFVLLDTVEKQAEQNVQLQQKINKLTEKLDSKADSLTQVAEQKIDVTQKRFDNIVYLSTKHVIEQNLPTLLENVIRENADFRPIETALDRAVESLNEQINGRSSLYENLHKSNMQKTKDLANALEYQKESLAKEHYKLIGIVSVGLFFAMCVFFAIIYFMTVPTNARLEELREDKAQLIADINQLKRNRAEWIKDASKNGYLKR